MASVRLWARRLHKDFSSARRTLCAPNEIPTSPPTIVSCSVPPSPERDPLFPSFHARHRQRSLTFSHRGHQASPAPGPCPRLMLVFLTNTLTSPHSHDSHPTQGASLRALDSCSPRPVSAAALSLHICKKYLMETRNSCLLSARQDFGLDEDTPVISSLCYTTPNDLLPA